MMCSRRPSLRFEGLPHNQTSPKPKTIAWPAPPFSNPRFQNRSVLPPPRRHQQLWHMVDDDLTCEDRSLWQTMVFHLLVFRTSAKEGCWDGRRETVQGMLESNHLNHGQCEWQLLLLSRVEACKAPRCQNPRAQKRDLLRVCLCNKKADSSKLILN